MNRRKINMKKGFWIILAIILAGGLVLTAYFTTNSAKQKLNPGEQVKNELIDVTVAQTGDFLLYSALYVALDSGAFERNGLDVKIVSTGGDEKSVIAVIAGQADFGVGDPTFASLAQERGQDVRVIGSVVNGVPFWGVTNSEDVANKYQKTGLDGLKVATFPAPSTAYTLQKDMYEDLGLTPAVVQGAFGSLIGIMEAGKADVALELEPNVSLMADRGARVLYSLTDLYGDFAITGVTVDADFMAENPKTVRAFLLSLQDAMDFMRADEEKTLDLLDNRFPELANTVVEASLDRMLSENVIPYSAIVTEEAWRKAVDLRIEVGEIKQRDKALSALDMSVAKNLK